MNINVSILSYTNPANPTASTVSISGLNLRYDTATINTFTSTNIVVENTIVGPANLPSNLTNISGNSITYTNGTYVFLESNNLSATRVSVTVSSTFNYLSISNSSLTNMSITQLSSTNLTAKSLNYANMSVNNITTNYIFVENLSITNLTTQTTSVTKIETILFSGANLTVTSDTYFTNMTGTNLTVNNATVSNIYSNNTAFINYILASNTPVFNNLTVNNLTITNATLSTLTASTISVGNYIWNYPYNYLNLTGSSLTYTNGSAVTLTNQSYLINNSASITNASVNRLTSTGIITCSNFSVNVMSITNNLSLKNIYGYDVVFPSNINTVTGIGNASYTNLSAFGGYFTNVSVDNLSSLGFSTTIDFMSCTNIFYTSPNVLSGFNLSCNNISETNLISYTNSTFSGFISANNVVCSNFDSILLISQTNSIDNVTTTKISTTNISMINASLNNLTGTNIGSLFNPADLVRATNGFITNFTSALLRANYVSVTNLTSSNSLLITSTLSNSGSNTIFTNLTVTNLLSLTNLYANISLNTNIISGTSLIYNLASITSVSTITNATITNMSVIDNMKITSLTANYLTGENIYLDNLSNSVLTGTLITTTNASFEFLNAQNMSIENITLNNFIYNNLTLNNITYSSLLSITDISVSNASSNDLLFNEITQTSNITANNIFANNIIGGQFTSTNQRIGNLSVSNGLFTTMTSSILYGAVSLTSINTSAFGNVSYTSLAGSDIFYNNVYYNTYNLSLTDVLGTAASGGVGYRLYWVIGYNQTNTSSGLTIAGITSQVWGTQEATPVDLNNITKTVYISQTLRSNTFNRLYSFPLSSNPSYYNRLSSLVQRADAFTDAAIRISFSHNLSGDNAYALKGYTWSMGTSIYPTRDATELQYSPLPIVDNGVTLTNYFNRTVTFYRSFLSTLSLAPNSGNTELAASPMCSWKFTIFDVTETEVKILGIQTV